MKYIILFIIPFVVLSAQRFEVEKKSGEVSALRGLSENFIPVEKGAKLDSSDLVVTGENSFVVLKKNESRFMLRSNCALSLDYLKKISVNDLLLALAMEEIRSISPQKQNGKVKNTAVYGEKSENKTEVSKESEIGYKRINGAKELAENGYETSGIIFARETYRKYPSTRKMLEERIYFTELLIKLELLEEAASELKEIKKISGENKLLSKINDLSSLIKSKILDNKSK